MCTSDRMVEIKSDMREQALVQVLAFVLEKMVEANSMDNQLDLEEQPVTKFHALRPPGISIRDYLRRIHKYAACSPECFVLSLVYIDRLIQRNGFVLNSLNVHRVVISSIVLAAKFFDDQYYNNAYYAKVGGIPVSEMNSLEIEFLFLLSFSLHVSTDDYSKYYNELSHHYVFVNAMHAYGPSPAHIEHYITEGPVENELVYITKTVPDGSLSMETSINCNNVNNQQETNENAVVLGVNA